MLSTQSEGTPLTHAEPAHHLVRLLGWCGHAVRNSIQPPMTPSRHPALTKLLFRIAQSCSANCVEFVGVEDFGLVETQELLRHVVTEHQDIVRVDGDLDTRVIESADWMCFEAIDTPKQHIRGWANIQADVVISITRSGSSTSIAGNNHSCRSFGYRAKGALR